MALQPSLRPLLIAGKVDAPHTLDVFCKRFFHAMISLLTRSVYSGLCLSIQVTLIHYQRSPVLNILCQPKACVNR